MNKEDTKKTQYDLIREDIDLIDKYKNTQNFDGLLNDMLIHIKSAEVKNNETQSQLAQANNKIEKIKEYVTSGVVDDSIAIETILSIIEGVKND